MIRQEMVNLQNRVHEAERHGDRGVMLKNKRTGTRVVLICDSEMEREQLLAVVFGRATED